MAEVRQSYSATVAGTIDDCFAVLTDFESYPKWSSPIKKTRVLERHPDGLAKRVEFTLDMTIKTIRYVLEYQWEPPVGATWHLVEGDLPAVLINGMGKSNPTAAEVAAEYERTTRGK